MPLKAIRSKADLAINGAPPTFDQPMRIGRQTVSLPLSAKLTDVDIERIVDAVRNIVR